MHFALNRMAVSCPRVPFEAARVDAQLDKAARPFFSEAQNVAFDAGANVVRFSSILDFYPEDFLRVAPSLVAYANRYRAVPVPEGRRWSSLRMIGRSIASRVRRHDAAACARSASACQCKPGYDRARV